MDASQLVRQREAVFSQRLTSLFVLLIAAGCLIAVVVPAGLGWDFANFYDTGKRVAAGQTRDIYDATTLIAGHPPQGSMRFWGTPISALFYVPLGWFSPGTALVLFKIENILALAASVIVLFQFYRPFVPKSPPAARAAFAATLSFLCLIYQPFWTVFRVGGQTTATVLLFAALGLVAHTRGWLWTSAICVALAVLIKPALAPMLVLLGLVSGVPFLWRMGSVLAVIGVVSLATLGWPIHATFLGLMAGGVQQTFPWYFNSSLDVLVENVRLALSAHVDSRGVELIVSGLSLTLKAAVVGTVLFVLLKSRSRAWTVSARRHFHFLMAIIFFLLVSRTVWEHYLALLFVPLMYVLAVREYFSRAALGLVAAIFVLSIGQNLILIEFLRQRLVLDTPVRLLAIALFKTAPLTLTMVLLWRHWRELLDSHASPTWQHGSVASARAV